MIISKDNFFKKVNLFHGITYEDCWEWTGAKDRDGYGRFGCFNNFGRRIMLGAHRAFWIMFKGEIPKGLCVLHSCDCPSCVNGYHLFLGTDLDNNRDMISKGRQKYVGSPKLTKEQVIEMRTAPKRRGIQKHFMEKFGVDQTTISDVFTGRTWKDLKI